MTRFAMQTETQRYGLFESVDDGCIELVGWVTECQRDREGQILLRLADGRTLELRRIPLLPLAPPPEPPEDASQTTAWRAADVDPEVEALARDYLREIDTYVGDEDEPTRDERMVPPRRARATERDDTLAEVIRALDAGL